MEKISWIQNGSNFRRVEGNVSNVDVIPNGIYNVQFDPFSGWSLEKIAEEFTFNHKVYGLQTDFINHVVKTFENTKGNLGVLMSGTKGSGKTIASKILANKLNLPIIIVKSFGDNNSALVEYLSSFNFDCVLFMDEFEKTWNENDSSILQIMDGVFNSNFRRVFLLTTNELRINENLLSRPSRIRYLKEFGNLSADIVREYLNDNLQHPECIDCIVDFVDTLQISTIDILKTIVEDINIHGFETFLENKNIFNVKTASYIYTVHRTCFNSVESVMKRHCTIESFAESVKNSIKYPQPKSWEFDTVDEYKSAQEEYDAHRSKYSIDSTTVCTQKSVKSMHIGDRFGVYEEYIIQIDLDKHIIVTKEGDGSIYFYYITNVDSKPSLYKDSAYTNPYFM